MCTSIPHDTSKRELCVYDIHVLTHNTRGNFYIHALHAHIHTHTHTCTHIHTCKSACNAVENMPNRNNMYVVLWELDIHMHSHDALFRTQRNLTAESNRESNILNLGCKLWSHHRRLQLLTGVFNQPMANCALASWAGWAMPFTQYHLTFNTAAKINLLCNSMNCTREKCSYHWCCNWDLHNSTTYMTTFSLMWE